MKRNLKLFGFFLMFLNCFQPVDKVFSAEAADFVKVEKTTEETEEIGLSPFQFLNLTTANSDHICFVYKIIRNGNEPEQSSIYRKGEDILAIFPAAKKDGQRVRVRQLETAGLVYYILDSEKKVFQYRGPARDILLNQMQNIVKDEPVKVFKKDGAMVYEYHQAFEHDDQITLSWQFFMKDGSLSKLEYYFDGKVNTIYEFSGFTQDEPAPDLFMIPEGYEKITFDYVYTGDTMPPWFE